MLPLASTFGVGSLPHRDSDDAVSCAWNSTTLPTMPTLPRRSPAEGMIAQALLGLDGVTVGQYGGISVDTTALSAPRDSSLDLMQDAFVGYRTFLASIDGSRRDTGHVKWQCVGPVTLAVALMRVGVDTDKAFDIALEAVRVHVREVQKVVAAALPGARQIVVIDEPSLHDVLTNHDVRHELVVDNISSALAALQNDALGGLHSCADHEWAAMFDAGAMVLSVPVPHGRALDDLTMHISRFSEHFERGGYIAWGVIRTDGPVPASVERPWRDLMKTWCSLVSRGLDPELLVAHSAFTPACGLGTHSEGVANRVFELLAEVAVKVADPTTISRLTHGQ